MEAMKFGLFLGQCMEAMKFGLLLGQCMEARSLESEALAKLFFLFDLQVGT